MEHIKASIECKLIAMLSKLQANYKNDTWRLRDGSDSATGGWLPFGPYALGVVKKVPFTILVIHNNAWYFVDNLQGPTSCV